MNLKMEEIKNLIEENNIDEIKKIINSEIVIRKLIDANDVAIITFICDNLITDDITEPDYHRDSASLSNRSGIGAV